jgi:hypothetical protein
MNDTKAILQKVSLTSEGGYKKQYWNCLPSVIVLLNKRIHDRHRKRIRKTLRQQSNTVRQEVTP